MKELCFLYPAKKPPCPLRAGWLYNYILYKQQEKQKNLLRGAGQSCKSQFCYVD